MQFQENKLYHIYNQGNNKQKIFFKRENYLYFLRKIKTYVIPYADITAWCLMPNHFHLMLRVRETSIGVKQSGSEGFTQSEIGVKQSGSEGFTQSKPLAQRTFNQSIGILLRSYTRAINKQEKRSGSLFRKETKAECVNCFKGNTPLFVANGINIRNYERQYPQILFDYIHLNPVRAHLTVNLVDWEFSSARDYYAGRRGQIVNKTLAAAYVDIV
jgi:putative transposase